MAYAITSDLADFLGTAEEDLPFDAERLLDRASETIDFITFGRSKNDVGNIFDSFLNRTGLTPEQKALVLKNATCAQVEYMITLGEEFDVLGSPDSVALGAFNINQKFTNLGPRAKRILTVAGLLTRSIDMF